MKQLVLCGLALLMLACPNNTPQPKDVVELMPGDDEISGWTRNSALKIAENREQLYSLIDGPADDYVSHGFVKSAFQGYGGTVNSVPVTMEVRVFDMGDTTNARSTYAFFADGTETPWTDNKPGAEARIKNLVTAYEVGFWSDKFYFWGSISDGTDAALAVAKLFALNVGAAIGDSAQ